VSEVGFLADLSYIGGSVAFQQLLYTILLRVTKKEALECIRRLIVRLSKIVGSSYIFKLKLTRGKS
jgi:hypothetical protein